MRSEITTAGWTKAGVSNVLLAGDGFKISYNPTPDCGIDEFASDGQAPETAILAHGKYYILNGDWRAEYERLVPQGLEVCIQFFLEHREHKSSWSDTPREEKALS